MVGVTTDMEVSWDLFDSEIALQSAAQFVFEALTSYLDLPVLGWFVQ